MKILAIETSCDDTAIAILDTEGGGFKLLSNVVASQVEVHKKWGGVYPTLAKREHQKNLVPVLIKSLKEAKLLSLKPQSPLSKQFLKSKAEKLEKILEREAVIYKKLVPFFKKHQKPEIDALAITVGPGLEPSLWAGINFAKALAFYWDLPVIEVNHVKAHVFANNLKQPLSKDDFPAVCLVVSGGHTILFLMEDFGKYKIIGETRDDAAGECFDKTAKILGLPYPGGPEIAKLAKLAEPRAPQVRLPRPMINSDDYDFSFSGLKTAVLYQYREQPKKIQKSRTYKIEMAREIQQSIIDVLIKKTIRAAKDFKAKAIIIGGGVSANKELRRQMAKKAESELPKTKLLIPDAELSTDNAAMIAVAATYRLEKGKEADWKTLEAQANLRI